MTDTACSTCGNPAVRLLGGSCQACATRCPLGCPACAYGCPCRRCHYQGDAVAETLEVLRAARQRPPMPEDERAHMLALAAEASEDRRTTEEVMATLEAVRPGANTAVRRHLADCAAEAEKLAPLHGLPPGAHEAVERLTTELRTEGVEVGVLRPEALPASIEEAIVGLEGAGVDFGTASNEAEPAAAEWCERAKDQLRAAIRAELDATEQRVREAVHVEGMRAGVERRRTRAPSSSDVCGVRAAAWMGMTAEARTCARVVVGWMAGPLCIACPPQGCGAAAGEPCRETVPPAPEALLRDELAAALREADRWRHGVTIEGDYVCPDSLRADAVQAELDALRRRYLASQGELHREAARAETAERELAALRVKRRPVVCGSTWCEDCASAPCVCHEAGLP